MRKRNYLGRFTVMAAAIVAGPAPAQMPIGKPMLVARPKAVGIDASALKRLEPIQTRYNIQIIQAFKGNEPLKALMEADLKAISATRDNARKRTMIIAYQKKYGAQFKSILAAGRVDMNAAVRDMSAAVPGTTFTLSDGMFVKAITNPTAVPPTSTTPSSPSTSPTLAPTEVRTLRGTDFTFSKTRDCSNISDGDANQTGLSMRAEASSVVGGQCFSEGTMTSYDFRVAENQYVEVDLTFDLSAETSAVGIVGSASSRAYSQITVEGEAIYGAVYRGTDLLFEKVACDTFVVFLMASSEECVVNRVNKSVSLYSPGKYRIVAKGFASSMSLAGAGDAEAKLGQLRAVLTFRSR